MNDNDYFIRCGIKKDENENENIINENENITNSTVIDANWLAFNDNITNITDIINRLTPENRIPVDNDKYYCSNGLVYKYISGNWVILEDDEINIF